MQDNEIAEDYRQQRLLAKGSKGGFPHTSKESFLVWLAENKDRQLQKLRDNGISYDVALKAHDEYIWLVCGQPEATRYDFVGFSLVLRNYLQEIESNLLKSGLQIPNLGKVVSGAIWSSEIDASQLNVLTTSSSIIQCTTGLLNFINSLSKLLSKTWMRNSTTGLVSYCPDFAINKIKADPILLKNWALFFSVFANSYTMNNYDFGEFSGAEQNLRMELTQAMHVFVLSHEYGHHIAQHGLQDSSVQQYNIHEQEFEADLFSFGVLRTFSDNFQAYFYTGPIALLKAFELLEKVIDNVGCNNTGPRNGTHPEATDRILAIEKLDKGYSEEELVAAVDVRACTVKFFDDLYNAIEPFVRRPS